MAKSKSPTQAIAVLSKRIKEKFAYGHLLSTRDLEAIGRVAIAEMKKRVARGLSPLERGERFPAYKNPKRYPGKRKPRRPVNLYLTGQFLGSLAVQAFIGKAPRIRIYFTNERARLKERGHREGAGGQPKRPIMLQAGEQLSNGIRVKVGAAIKKAIEKAIRLDKKR